MIDLFLAIISAVLIGVVIHINERKDLNRVYIMAVNYWIAVFLTFLMPGKLSWALLPLEWTLAVITGIMFILGFFVIMHSIRQKGLTIPVIIMRLSVIIPVSISIVFFREIPSFYQILAISLTLLIIFLLAIGSNPKNALHSLKANWKNVLLLLIVLGTADTLLKTYKELGRADFYTSYLQILFLVAGIIATVISLKQKVPFTKNYILAGALLGIPNFFTSFFMLRALKNFEAIIVFPVFNISIIIISAIIGIAFWNEKLTTLEKTALILAIPTLILINF